MNELRVIEPIRIEKKRRVDEIVKHKLSQIHSPEAMEEFMFENIISTNIFDVVEFEEDYLIKIVDGLISARWKISVEDFAQGIHEHNSEIIFMAIDHLRINLGNDLWMETVKINYDIDGYIYEEYGDEVDEIDKIGSAMQSGFEEEIYSQMRETHFEKIVMFCEANNVELHMSEESEIYDLLLYSNVLESKHLATPILMPNINKAILCPALSGLTKDKVFIMENTLYVPKQAVRGATNEYIFGS